MVLYLSKILPEKKERSLKAYKFKADGKTSTVNFYFSLTFSSSKLIWFNNNTNNQSHIIFITALRNRYYTLTLFYILLLLPHFRNIII